MKQSKNSLKQSFRVRARFNADWRSQRTHLLHLISERNARRLAGEPSDEKKLELAIDEAVQELR